MRKLKFRVWDKEEQIFLSGEWRLKAHLGKFSSVHTPKSHSMSVERFDIQQFTGLVDKNNVEIYEGDILLGKCFHQPMIVVWDEGTCRFDLQDRDCSMSEHLFDTTGSGDLGYNYWEVLGNACQHPRLLENA